VAVSPIVHVDIPLRNPEADTNFYRDVFGWQIDSSMPGYPMYSAEGGPGGGFPQKGNGPQAMPGVRVYLQVPNIEAALRQVEERGGKTVTPRIDIEGGHGAFAVFEDPSGNTMAVYQAPNRSSQ